jgi:hypothetical protein
LPQLAGLSGQSAIGDRDGLWMTVVAAAVFVDLPDGK